jgi:hypothetical protein
MPCYRCGTRQVDPERGKSPWKRGVLREHQVLVCPACQPAADADLDRCARCGSVHLIRRLDQVECLDCRLIREPEFEPSLPALVPPEGDGGGGSGVGGGSGGGAARGAPPRGPGEGAVPHRQESDPALAAEVARALEKVLGRP